MNPYTYYCLKATERQSFEIEDYLEGRVKADEMNIGSTRTRTFVHKNLGTNHKEFESRVFAQYDIPHLVLLVKINAENYSNLKHQNLNDYYQTWRIPKKKGGFRTLCQATGELKSAQKVISELLNLNIEFSGQWVPHRYYERCLRPMTYHTSAYAYMKGRGVQPCLKKHSEIKYRPDENGYQVKGARWLLQLDFSDFFGSTTEEFVNQQLKMIFPWNYVYEFAEEEMRFLISLCFKDGGLPQGSTTSPVITNLMMIPIDHKIANGLWKWNELDSEGEVHNRCFMYTRYADDMQISAQKKFNVGKIVNFIKSVLEEFNAPFKLNDAKTKFTSRAGGIWLFGMMYGQDGEIRIGHNTKKQLRSQLCHYIEDFKNGLRWSLYEVQKMNGIISWYNSVEEGYISKLFETMNNKFHCNIRDMITMDLRGV